MTDLLHRLPGRVKRLIVWLLSVLVELCMLRLTRVDCGVDDGEVAGVRLRHKGVSNGSRGSSAVGDSPSKLVFRSGINAFLSEGVLQSSISSSRFASLERRCRIGGGGELQERKYMRRGQRVPLAADI